MFYFKKYLIIGSTLLLCVSCDRSRKSNMLPFSLLLADSITVIHSEQIPEGKPIMLLFFSPDCEHCQQETKGIIENMSTFQQMRLYFITIDDLDRIRVFNKYYNLTNYPNITVGKDINYDMIKNYKVPGTPYTLVYDGYKQKKITLNGPWSIDSLVEQIHKMKII